MNGLLRRQMVAQALLVFSRPREQGGCGLAMEDADGAAQLYDGMLRQLETGENAIAHIEPVLPDDIRTGVVASYQNTLQIAALAQLNVALGRKVLAQQEIIEQQAKLIGRAVAQNEALLEIVQKLQDQVRSAVALVNQAATRPLTDDDTRH